MILDILSTPSSRGHEHNVVLFDGDNDLHRRSSDGASKGDKPITIIVDGWFASWFSLPNCFEDEPHVRPALAYAQLVLRIVEANSFRLILFRRESADPSHQLPY
jgi:hypothetical protein